jgi:hypothetical protein
MLIENGGSAGGAILGTEAIDVVGGTAEHAPGKAKGIRAGKVSSGVGGIRQ